LAASRIKHIWEAAGIGKRLSVVGTIREAKMKYVYITMLSWQMMSEPVFKIGYNGQNNIKLFAILAIFFLLFGIVYPLKMGV
jgi:hypothetical protein